MNKIASSPIQKISLSLKVKFYLSKIHWPNDRQLNWKNESIWLMLSLFIKFLMQ